MPVYGYKCSQQLLIGPITTEVVGADPRRLLLRFDNLSRVADAYLRPSTADTLFGIVTGDPMGFLELTDRTHGPLVQEAWVVRADTGINLFITEVYLESP